MTSLPFSVPFRSPDLLIPEASELLLIDVQEKLIPLIAGNEQVVKRCRFLLEVARLLEVKTLVSEQYPKGLGKTIEPLTGFTESISEKTNFSAAEVVGPFQAQASPQSIVLMGIETHICVMQTAFDLHRLGYRVCVVTDAVGSRCETDHRTALERMRDQGITMVTSEMLAFEWCQSSKHPQFKAVSQLVTAASAD